jgi:hypothetical protein
LVNVVEGPGKTQIQFDFIAPTVGHVQAGSAYVTEWNRFQATKFNVDVSMDDLTRTGE